MLVKYFMITAFILMVLSYVPIFSEFMPKRKLGIDGDKRCWDCTYLMVGIFRCIADKNHYGLYTCERWEAAK